MGLGIMESSEQAKYSLANIWWLQFLATISRVIFSVVATNHLNKSFVWCNKWWSRPVWRCLICDLGKWNEWVNEILKPLTKKYLHGTIINRGYSWYENLKVVQIVSLNYLLGIYTLLFSSLRLHNVTLVSSQLYPRIFFFVVLCKWCPVYHPSYLLPIVVAFGSRLEKF